MDFKYLNFQLSVSALIASITTTDIADNSSNSLLIGDNVIPPPKNWIIEHRQYIRIGIC